MQTVKVKIKKLSKGGGIKPLYQQDKLGGLNAYALPMQFKEKDEEEGIKNNEEIVDRNEANVELEKGEVVSRGVITATESSDFPQLTKVGGKKHSQGGTPAILDAGDFVFSEYLKMSEEEIKALGETGKNKSYANIASKYIKPFNNAVHKLNTSKDKLEKETAALSIEGIKNKLSKIAMLQESGKGFPDETGFEAKTGGLYKMQDAGEFTQREGRRYRISKTPPKEVPDFADDNFDYFDIFGRKGSMTKGSSAFNKAFRDASRKGLKEFSWNGKRYTTQKSSNTPDDFVAVPNKAVDDDMMIYPQEYDFSEQPVTVSTNPEPKTKSSKEQIRVDDPLNIYKKNFKDTGFGTMEVIDMLSPFVQPINRYAPIKKRIEAEQMNFRPVDFEAQRQAVKGQVNTAQNQNVLISPSSSISSARNAQLLGQGLDVLNQSFMQEFNTNQMGYQNTEAQNTQMRQQANQVNAGLADDYDTKYAQMNENFDARKSQQFRQFLQKWYSADNNRSMRNLMNYMMTDYEIGPNNTISYLPQTEDQKIARITGSSSTGQSSNLYQMAEMSLKNIGIENPTEDDIKKEALRMRGQNLNINNQRSFEMFNNMLMQYINNQNTRNIQGLGYGASDNE